MTSYAAVKSDKPARAIEDLLRAMQTRRDAQVVRELMDACEEQRKRRKPQMYWHATAWLIVAVQAIVRLILKR